MAFPIKDDKEHPCVFVLHKSGSIGIYESVEAARKQDSQLLSDPIEFVRGKYIWPKEKCPTFMDHAGTRLQLTSIDGMKSKGILILSSNAHHN